MINLFLDTNILIKTGIVSSPFYQKLKILNDANIINVYIHEYIIEEYKNHVYLEYSKIKKEIERIEKESSSFNRKYGIELQLESKNEKNIKQMAEIKLNEFIRKYNFNIIQVNHEAYFLTFDDYFKMRNAFEHPITDMDKRKKVKMNFIDSMIAHTYMKNIAEENIFITQNIKDFSWMSKRATKLALYDDLESYFERVADAYVENINKNISEPLLRNVLDNIDFKNKLTKLISEMITGIEGIEINSENFEYCVNSEVEYHIYDNIDANSIKLYEPIIEKENDHYNITISFSFEIIDNVLYVASVSDLIQNNILNFDINNISINQVFSENIQIHDYDGEEVIEIIQNSEIKIFGFFSSIFMINYDLNEIDNIIKYLKNKGDIKIQYEKCSASPIY